MNEKPDSTDVVLKTTDKLPDLAASYTGGYCSRIAADPLGKYGTRSRDEVNAIVLSICRELQGCGREMIGGDELARRVGLPDARALRYFVAYARVHHRIREIVSLEGSGYFWGPHNPELYSQAAVIAKAHALSELYIASLYTRQPAAVELAQMAFDFAADQGRADGRGNADAKQNELDLLMAADGIKPADVIEALIEQLGKTETGRETLGRIGQKHAQVLLGKRELAEMRELTAKLQDHLNKVATA